MGSWELQLTETLGMDHSRELDALNSKLINEEPNISENIRPDDYDDSDSSTDSFIEFSPFGVPGQRAHERRRATMVHYIVGVRVIILGLL